MHGIKVNEPLTGTRPILENSLAIIGLIATATAAVGAATAALDDAFPLNQPVLVTDVRSAIGKAGTGGTLGPALAGIADQTSPIVVVVRVAPGLDAEATDDNVIGSTAGGNYTGMQALLAAEAQLGVRPRILGAPGLDSQAVTTAMVVVAKQLRAMVYARAVADNIAEAVTYRENFAARELMLIWPDFSGDFAGDAIARALGLRAKIDAQVGWHKTISNIAVDGVSGLSHDVFFDLTDDTTDAGVLNAAPVTTLIRSNGFRFWGNRTTSDEPQFAFESAVRTSHALQDEIAAGLAWAVDKPVTVSLIKDVLETINARFRALKAQGRIIDGRAWYDPSLNENADLAAGRVAIDYEYTPCAPAEQITLNQRITDRFYAGFADQLA
jgi:hypothetical protein